MINLQGLRVGFWGLGNMGSPMARHLIASGAHTWGFDRDESALDRFVGSGGRRKDLTEIVTELDIVILMLPGSEAVESVVGELLDLPMRPGTLIIDMSSSEPLRTRVLAQRVESAGFRMLDAPVSGGITGAEDATLTVMVGGLPEVAAEVASLFALLGTAAVVGPAGAGHALKALNNLMSGVHLWATTEAMIAGREFGLNPATMLAAINRSSGRSGSTENKWPNFILPETYNSGFALALMLKDMKIGVALAHALGTPVQIGDAAVSAWSAAAEELPANSDHTEIAKVLNAHFSPRTT